MHQLHNYTLLFHTHSPSLLQSSPDIMHYHFLLSDSKLHCASEYQMSCVEIQLGIRCQKGTRCFPYPAPSFSYRVTLQKRCTSLSCWQVTPTCRGFKLEPCVKIKQRVARYKAKCSDSLTMGAQVVQQRSACVCNAAFKHSRTCRPLIRQQPSNLHRYTKSIKQCADNYTYMSTLHARPNESKLADCGEGCAVMQRKGPYTGLHVHCLGIITSNLYG